MTELLRRWTIALAVFSALVGCGTVEPRFEIVAGPETPSVLEGTRGHVGLAVGRSAFAHVTPVTRRGPVSITPYEREGGVQVATVLPETTDSVLDLEYTAGPQGGTIALVRLTCTARRGAYCDGYRTSLAQWASGRSNAVYRKTLSLSPDSRYVAVLPDSQPLRFADYSPRLPAKLRFRTDRHVGDLFVVDVQTGESRRVVARVLDGEPVSWSADGRDLLLTRVETVDALPTRLAAEVRGDEGLQGTGVPVVEVVDVASGEARMLALGMNAIRSPDGRSLIFESSIDHLTLRDLQTGADTPLVLPGFVGRYPWLRFVGPRKVVYRALPTEGTEPGYTGHNSPLVGPKQLVSLKVADLDTLRFATVYTDLDPRTNLAYTERF